MAEGQLQEPATARQRPDWAEAAAGTVCAAVDLGTNNCRLLVARPGRGAFRVIDSYARITRLGEGLEATGRLSEAAILRTIEALGECALRMRRRQTRLARCVATEACRRAGNAADFVERVRQATGIDLEIIDATEEARLALDGCRPLIEAGARHALVFDIGGGSTELMWVTRQPGGGLDIAGLVSLPLGVVTLAERFGGETVDPEAYAAMVEAVAAALRPFEASHDLRRRFKADGVQVLGTSGTVTTLAGVHLGLGRYDRARIDGLWVAARDYAAARERVRAMTLAERLAHPCIGPGRADLVVAGCAVLDAITGLWPEDRLRVADRGLREGILQQLTAQAGSPAARRWAWPV